MVVMTMRRQPQQVLQDVLQDATQLNRPYTGRQRVQIRKMSSRAVVIRNKRFNYLTYC